MWRRLAVCCIADWQSAGRRAINWPPSCIQPACGSWEVPCSFLDLLTGHEPDRGSMGRSMAPCRALESQNGENIQPSTFNFERPRAFNSRAGWRLGVECSWGFMGSGPRPVPGRSAWSGTQGCEGHRASLVFTRCTPGRRAVHGKSLVPFWTCSRTMNQANGAPVSDPASRQTASSNEPCREAGAPVHGKRRPPKSDAPWDHEAAPP
jgi:hypothetical protein